MFDMFLINFPKNKNIASRKYCSIIVRDNSWILRLQDTKN